MPRVKRPKPPLPPPPERSARPRHLIIGLGIAALAGGGAWWLSRAVSAPIAPPAKPNVLLITLDTTRADRLGSYGDANAATPNLDRLAAAGVRFEQALASAPLTLPSHASLMTGRQPYTHGVRNNGYFTLAEDVPTIAASFAAAGYDTAAFVSSFVLDAQFGLARGFAHYDASLDAPPPGAPSSLESERRGDRTVAAATAWLRARARGTPFFLWVHLYDPHDPYAPPPPFRERFAGRLYDGEIAFADALVGTLLQEIGYPASPTLVMAAGDHGESLGEHGESTHGLFVYESALRVPLVIAGPGIAPAVVKEPVRLIDITPTLADLAGLPAMAGVEGRTLRPLLSGQPDGDEPPPVYAETYFPEFFMGWAPLRSIRAGRWKYIEAPEPELYDLSTDAAERTNVIASETAAATSLARALRSTASSGAGRMTPTPLTDQARERLASLGYVSAITPPHVDTAATAPDPKKMVATFERLLEGNRALASGRPDVAARAAADVIRTEPANAFALLLQGRAALAQGQNRAAMAAFRAYLALVPRSADAHHWTALAALRLGDRARALAEEEAAIALDPRHASAIALRAGLLFSTGRADEGIAALREALRQDPASQTLGLDLADLLADAKRFPEAETEYRRVLERRPGDGRALTGLAVVFGATNRLDLALEQLNRVLEIEPRNDEARLERSQVYARLGRTNDARDDLERLAQEATRADIREAARRALK
jgi:arylsulfatase A-like enzyme/regulator of sirC expression with transglutaminase-like and TPR domain